jgi:hypothetical protein
LINERDIALIDEFVAGKLIGNDKTDFEARVKRDLEFAKAVRQQIHAVEHVEIFGAVHMGQSLRGDMKQWKSNGGYKPYKSEMMAKMFMIKAIVSVVLLAAIGGAVWYFFLKVEPPVIEKPEPVQEEVEYIPEPPVEVEDTTTMDSLSLTELKSSEDQIADVQLDIQDPMTFSIVEILEEDGVYTYEIKYDDQVKTIKSQDPDLDDKLTEMANEAIQESSQKSVPQTRTQTAPRQRVVKEEPAVEEKKVEPVKKTQPKPVRRKTNTKVEDDFPY